jgi:hypothetical protein
MIDHGKKNTWVVCNRCNRIGPKIKGTQPTAVFDAIEAAEREGWFEVETPPTPGLITFCSVCIVTTPNLIGG